MRYSYFLILLFYSEMDSTVENEALSPNTSSSVQNLSENKYQNEENYSPAKMAEDLSKQNEFFGPDASRRENELKANQPRTFSYPTRTFGKEQRSFLPSWYDKWDWLHYVEVEDSVYCIICKNAERYGMLTNVKVEDSFVRTGYTNWKKARCTNKGFNKHESSKCHEQAMQRLIEIPKSTKDVSQLLQSNLTDLQSQSRASLLKIISCLRYLARQGLPLRGHGDDKDSNVTQLLKFRAEDDPAFKEWLEKKQAFTSPEIQNEILKEMSLLILRDIVECIKGSDFHSFMLDESGDKSNKEQAVCCVRWVDENLFSHEDFLGLYEMEKTDASSIVEIIKDLFLRMGFDSNKLRGQCYDGCSTMMGKKNGVAKKIKDDLQPLALSTHCYAHSLNLACGDWIRNCGLVSKSLDTSYEITKLIKFSPKRDSHLRKIHEEEYYEDEDHSNFITLKLFSQTRWTVRAGSLISILENYKELETLWDWCLKEYKDSESKARVLGVQAQMRNFDYFYGLNLGILLLRHSDNLSSSLQAKDLCASQAQTMAKKTIIVLEKIRTDQDFNLFWKKVTLKAESLNVDEPKLPRKRKAPARIEDCFGGKAAPEYLNDAVSYYRRIYYESLDQIVNAIKDRFDQEDFRTYVNLENLLIKAARGEELSQELGSVLKSYGKDFDENRLEVQLETLQEYCKDINDTVCIRSIVSVLRHFEVKYHLSEVVKLAKLILVMPATNATSERTFSLMKLIKTYLRSTMRQDRLNHLMILSAYKDRLDQLDLIKVASSFIDKNESRKYIFGYFK